MTINEYMEKKQLTQYRLAKESGLAYTTIHDICNGKAQLEKCSAETIYYISKVLGISMESLIEPYLDKRCDFTLFRSNTCHKLKELGDIDFVIEVLEKDEIRWYYKKQWYRESLYLLAMLDYVSRENNIPICTQYDDLRKETAEYAFSFRSTCGCRNYKRSRSKRASYQRFNPGIFAI